MYSLGKSRNKTQSQYVMKDKKDTKISKPARKKIKKD